MPREILNYMIFECSKATEMSHYQSVSATNNSIWDLGSGCGAVGRDPTSEFFSLNPDIGHIVYYQQYWKDENKEKRGREWPQFFNNSILPPSNFVLEEDLASKPAN